MFYYPTLPLEWLLNYWNYTADTRLMLAFDPDREHNKDGDGDLYYNTGYIIAQNSTRTHEILVALEDCPRDTKYPGCGRYAYVMPREQAAFVGFLKRDTSEIPRTFAAFHVLR